MNVVRRLVTVTGSVQGVSFRYYCKKTAQRLGVSGWVGNQPDGSVMAVLEGDSDLVEATVEWMRHGPRLARIDQVSVVEEEPQGETGFMIR
ncbi:acylphosphatase [Saxibacter everestensis]|uniref:acylphosphatase n=1 Tax=Saxibacter everestensis TaxID=2909229 RepID=A0ABY8QY35_9MICO|nr:acylphosphatase [Brevibacteriaceae bacterium ZFBP1038]